MNYLAHSFLSFGNDEWLTGQFIADDVKGKKYLDYPEGIKNGILLHRFIDHTTDTAPVCLELRKVLRPDLGLFSGVAIDVYFDHMLSLKWNEYSKQPLGTHIELVYASLLANRTSLTTRMTYIIDRMREMNWLGRYKSIEGTSLTFSQMASRIPHGQALLKATTSMNTHYQKINETFDLFFPELISACEMKINTFAT